MVLILFINNFLFSFLETSLMSSCVVIGQTESFLLLINITSDLFVILDLNAKTSVTPIFLIFKRRLSIGHVIIPLTFFFNASL